MINPIKLPMNKTRVLSPQLLPIRGDSSPSVSNMGWSSGEDKSMAWTQIDGLDTKKKIMLLPSGKHTKNYEGVKNWETYRNPPKTLKSKIRSKNSDKVVGGLEHVDYFSIFWECHHPN